MTWRSWPSSTPPADCPEPRPGEMTETHRMRPANMRFRYCAVFCVLAAACGESSAQSIAVYPPDINLETARDRQSFVVQLTQPDGITRDVTEQAQVSFANTAL